MKMLNAAAKFVLLIALLAMMSMPASAGDKLQTGASKGDAKKHKKAYKIPCTDNCEENSARNLKKR